MNTLKAISITMTRTIVKARATSLCFKKLRFFSIKYDSLKACIIALTPLVAKINAVKKPNESNPPLGWLIISSIVVLVNWYAASGNKVLSCTNSCS